MTIRILPPILANQIAAGEVVERPSSVVKELVENSLDAGANKIEIDIEKGGARLIRIRDNGRGVAKDELVLALSRHATSKVATLDDLEKIGTLGFRGEALASISAVSRLTFTSQPEGQAQAWQAQAQGREMSVEIKPAAHPVGTTVEVADLFFNTPARRRFMRSEKTEFTHIDELLRRMALSHFPVTFILRHNGKVVRQYRAANSRAEQERRLATVCGAPFMHYALAVESEHSDVRLWGWLVTPEGARGQSDLQYTYVNGRMMRDKLINHAIRQAYDELLAADRSAAYVLYIELDPRQVDVNVHPAKHEVRFHQARFIHDFIYQVLFSALRQHRASPAVAENRAALPEEVSETAYQSSLSSADRATLHEPGHSYRAPVKNRAYGIAHHRDVAAAPKQEEMAGMRALLTTLPVIEPRAIAGEAPLLLDRSGYQALAVVSDSYLLLASEQGLSLLSLVRAERFLLKNHLMANWDAGLTSQPLLLPVTFPLAKELIVIAQQAQLLLKQFGVELKSGSRTTMIVTRVPVLLRQRDLARLLPELLQLLTADVDTHDEMLSERLCQWLVEQGIDSKTPYDLARATQLLTDLVANYSEQLTNKRFVRPLPLMDLLEEFEGD